MVLAEPVVLQRRVVDEGGLAAHEVRPRVRMIFAVPTAPFASLIAVGTFFKEPPRLVHSTLKIPPWPTLEADSSIVKPPLSYLFFPYSRRNQCTQSNAA
jgi:hypothetical protein